MERKDKIMKEAFMIFLENEKQNCEEREKALIADERKDEANLCKVEANIFDIFKTLYTVSEKQSKSDEECREMFMAKAKAIPDNWKKSYELAKEHNDSGKILIEETKLKVVDKIMQTFYQLMEG